MLTEYRSRSLYVHTKNEHPTCICRPPKSLPSSPLLIPPPPIPFQTVTGLSCPRRANRPTSPTTKVTQLSDLAPFCVRTRKSNGSVKMRRQIIKEKKKEDVHGDEINTLYIVKRPPPTKKPPVRCIRCYCFLSSLPLLKDNETADETDTSSYTASRRYHTSNARPTSSHSTDVEVNTSDDSNVDSTGGRSRTVLIYEQQR